MRPLPHPLLGLKLARYALAWLLLMVCMASLAQPFDAHIPPAAPAYGSSDSSLPDAPVPEPGQRLYHELLAESATPEPEPDPPVLLPGWWMLHSFQVPHPAVAASGLHVPDPLLGRYQANAPPRA